MKKKLTFKHFLIKRLVPWTIALIAIGTMMNIIMYVVMLIVSMQDMEAESLKARGNVVECFAKGYDTPEKISFYLADCVDYNSKKGQIAFSLADENYNLIASSEWDAFLIHSRERNAIDFDAVTDVYKCGSQEFIDLLKSSMDNKTGYVFEINEAYAKDGLFIPGNVTIFENDYETVVKTVDFTPKNKEEYTYLPRDEFFWRDAGTTEEKPLAGVLHAVGSGHVKGDFSTCGFSIIDTPEMNYRLYFAYTYDYWSDIGEYMLVNIVYMVLTAVGISFITAFVACEKYNKQYEIDEYRRNMTNALAHDLKTPLTAIYGYAENLKNNIHSEKKDYYADAVLENVSYMNSIITSTLELAKTEEESLGSKTEKVNLTALAVELFEKYRLTAEERGVKFTISGKNTVTADKKMISRAIENLISNAVKYTTENGTIEVVSDDKSISFINDCDKKLKGNTDELCKPFSKADESRSNRTGSGIGLSIVKNIVNLHGYKFEAVAEDGKFTARISFKKK